MRSTPSRVALYMLLALLAVEAIQVYAQEVSVVWNGTTAILYISGLKVYSPNATIVTAQFVNETRLVVVWECMVQPCKEAVVTVECLGGGGTATLGDNPTTEPSTHILYEYAMFTCLGNATVTVTVPGVASYTVEIAKPRVSAGEDYTRYALAGLVMMLAFTRNRRQMAIGLLVFSVVSQIFANVLGVSNPSNVYIASVLAGVLGAVFLII